MFEQTGSNRSDRIVYLSPPAPVNMSDHYYELVDGGHFLARRRFDVLSRMGDSLFRKARNAAEIGCGAGLLQKQIEDRYGIAVAGIDVNRAALEKNASRISSLYCYDIHQRAPEFREKFDLIFLCDVLEHVEDDVRFLESVAYHLTAHGSIVVSVPAWQFFYSQFDRAVGHLRRYTFPHLRDVARHAKLSVRDWTYWGLPMLPLLVARKVAAGRHLAEKQIVDSGLNPPGGRIMNEVLYFASKCEWIPQKLVGISLVVILAKPAQ